MNQSNSATFLSKIRHILGLIFRRNNSQNTDEKCICRKRKAKCSLAYVFVRERTELNTYNERVGWKSFKSFLIIMPPKTKLRESTTEKEKETASTTEAQPAAVTAALQSNDSVSTDCESSGPTPITKLDKSCGIGTADIKKLQEAGFCTVESIAFAPRKSLLAVKGISDAKADKLAVSLTPQPGTVCFHERYSSRLKQQNSSLWASRPPPSIIKNVRKSFN